MFEIIVTVLGAAVALVYVGFLAYSIKSIPLWVIVILSFGLMIRELVLELREGADRAQRNAGNR